MSIPACLLLVFAVLYALAQIECPRGGLSVSTTMVVMIMLSIDGIRRIRASASGPEVKKNSDSALWYREGVG